MTPIRNPAKGMKPLVLVTIVLLRVGYTQSQCPSTVPECTCETLSGQSRKNIRCERLSQIPAFTSSPEIFQKLDMDNPNNNIQVIQANAFSGIQVEEIDMSGQNIKLQSIHPIAFSGLEQYLTIVKLQGDAVLPPPFEQLKNITNLQVLELQLFNMPTIEESTKFNHFPYLRTLRLRNMNTNFVSSESFKNQLQELTVLEFANNHVQTFPKPAINRLRKLQHLSWLHNGMTTISYSSFDSLSSLIELDLRGNDIGEMFNGSFIGITDKLQFLSLQLNRLSKESIVPLGHHVWPELEQLNLGHMITDFTDIPNGLFRNMPKLANLIIPGNKLRVIKSNDFQGLGNMHALDLSENWINTIQKGALSPMTRLDTLDLRSQYDSSVNRPMNFSIDALKGAELALKTLHIQDNHLIDQYAWEAIGAMKNLVNLDISGTGLSDIPSLLFYSHDKLGSLTMRNNGMAVLRQESLYGLKYSLEVIDISNNQIYTIEECVFKGFNKLKYFFASQNSFVCDCNLYGLYQFLKAIPSPGLAIFACKNPANLAGMHLLNLEIGQFCSNPPFTSTCSDFTTAKTSNSTTETTSVLTTTTTSNSTSETTSILTTTAISNSTNGTTPVLTPTTIPNSTTETTSDLTTTTSNSTIETTSDFTKDTITNSTTETTQDITTIKTSNSTTETAPDFTKLTTSKSTTQTTPDFTKPLISNSTVETISDFTTTTISNPTTETISDLTTTTVSNQTIGTTPILTTTTISNTTIKTNPVLTATTTSNSTIETTSDLTTIIISTSTNGSTPILTTTTTSNPTTETTSVFTTTTTSNSTIGTTPVSTTTAISNPPIETTSVFTSTTTSNSTIGTTPVLTKTTTSNQTTETTSDFTKTTTSNASIGTFPVLTPTTTSNSTIGTTQIFKTTTISSPTIITTPVLTTTRTSTPTTGTTAVFTPSTTSNSTIGTASVVPLPDIRFGILNETTNTIEISWTVSGIVTYLKNFLVQYKQLGINNPQKKSFPLDKIKRDHPITGLNPGSRYEICFFIELTGSSKQILISCPTGTTKGLTTEVTTTTSINGSDKTVRIAGGVLGVVMCAWCLWVIVS